MKHNACIESSGNTRHNIVIYQQDNLRTQDILYEMWKSMTLFTTEK